jgi:NhaP-type Na+/H+ or K+/H+ antiporter
LVAVATIGGAVVGVVVGVVVVVCALTKMNVNNDNKKEVKNLLTFSGIFEVSIILFNRKTNSG